MSEETNKITIDAKGKSIGRVAGVAAIALRGKDKASFQNNKVPDVEVEIVNASKSLVTEKVKREKKFAKYSGYPGGLKFPSLGEIISKKGYNEAFRMAVKGMLPTNKQRDRLMRNLTVTE